MRELVKSSVQRRTSLLSLSEIQALKDEKGIVACPLCEPLSDGLDVGAGKVSLAGRQPFQRSAHRTGVLALCLTLRQLPLQPCHFLAMFCPPYPKPQTVLKENFTRFLHRYQQIRLISVNTDEDRAFRSGFGERDAKVANQLTVSLLDNQAVVGDGVDEVTEEVFRDEKRKFLSPSDCPDADCSVLSDSRIPTSFADKEEGERFFEGDSACQLRSFPSGITESDKADGRTGHLGIDNSFDLAVGVFVEGTSRTRLTAIPAGGRQLIADLLEGGQGCLQIFVVFQPNRDSAFCRFRQHFRSQRNLSTAKGGERAHSSVA